MGTKFTKELCWFRTGKNEEEVEVVATGVLKAKTKMLAYIRFPRDLFLFWTLFKHYTVPLALFEEFLLE